MEATGDIWEDRRSRKEKEQGMEEENDQRNE